jgi:hypothetical protein
MDNLVLTGIVSLISLYTAAILCAAGIILFFFMVWNAAVSGEYRTVLFCLSAVIVALSFYTGTGYWLKGTGRI